MSRLPHVPDALRRPLKWVGYPLFGLVVFVAALYGTLPRDRIQKRVEGAASAWLNADAKMDDFGLTLFSGAGVEASRLNIRTRPPTPGDKPQRYVLDDVVVHIGLVDYLRGRTDATFKAHLGAGKGAGAVRWNPDEGSLQLDLQAIPLGQLSTLSQGAGVPVDGALDVKADVKVPKGLMPQAVGSIEVTCDGCSVGDGKAKLVIPGDAMMSQGVTVPKVKLGRVTGSLVMDKGRATLKDFRGHSPDMDVELDGYVELRDPLAMSMVHVYLRVKFSDALVKREPTIELMNNMLGAQARRPDGYLGFSLSGVAVGLVPYPSKEPPLGVSLGRAPAVAGNGRAGAPPPSAMPLPRTPLPSLGGMPPMHVAEPPSAVPTMDVPAASPEPPPPPPPSSVMGGPPPPGPSGSTPTQMAPANAIPPPMQRFGPSLRNITSLGEGAGMPPGPAAGGDERREERPEQPPPPAPPE